MNKTERERKWLLKRLPKRVEWDDVLHIVQFYADDDVRYRMTQGLKKNPTYEKIIKKNISKGVNEETILEPCLWEEFWDKRREQNPKREITKKRHVLKYGDKVLEIDVFDGMSLIVMEIEDVDLNEEIKIPEEIGQEVLAEVTGIKSFNNSQLAINNY